MTAAADMETFQADVARVALAAISGQGFALAGAGALIAHGLLDRPTSDLDPFSPLPGGAGHVNVALQAALRAAGHHVTVNTTRATEGDYAQREVTRGEQSVQIDLGPGLAPVPTGHPGCRPRAAPRRRSRQRGRRDDRPRPAPRLPRCRCFAATLRRGGQLLELNARGRRRPGSADVLGGDGQVLPGQSHRPLVNRGVHLRGAVAQDAGHAVRVGIGLAQQARALVYRPGRVNNLTGRGRVPPCSGEAS